MYVTIGLPGCGKSTWAKNMNIKIVSSDEIRGELFGDESIQGNPKKVFDEVYRRLEQALDEGIDVIFDATNINDVQRARAIGMCEEAGYDCIAVYFDMDTQTCIERQNMRNRKVPEEVILRMAKNLVKPYEEEDWTNIIKI